MAEIKTYTIYKYDFPDNFWYIGSTGNSLKIRFYCGYTGKMKEYLESHNYTSFEDVERYATILCDHIMVKKASFALEESITRYYRKIDSEHCLVISAGSSMECTFSTESNERRRQTNLINGNGDIAYMMHTKEAVQKMKSNPDWIKNHANAMKDLSNNPKWLYNTTMAQRAIAHKKVKYYLFSNGVHGSAEYIAQFYNVTVSIVRDWARKRTQALPKNFGGYKLIATRFETDFSDEEVSKYLFEFSKSYN